MRYFLNVRTRDSLVVDDEGDEFFDTGRLYDYASQVVAELEREYPVEAADAVIVPVALEVTSEAGDLVFCLPIHARRC